MYPPIKNIRKKRRLAALFNCLRKYNAFNAYRAYTCPQGTLTTDTVCRYWW